MQLRTCDNEPFQTFKDDNAIKYCFYMKYMQFKYLRHLLSVVPLAQITILNIDVGTSVDKVISHIFFFSFLAFGITR